MLLCAQNARTMRQHFTKAVVSWKHLGVRASHLREATRSYASVHRLKRQLRDAARAPNTLGRKHKHHTHGMMEVEGSREAHRYRRVSFATQPSA